MSSDDSGDSGFDKEAEREKLREKYEQDERDRENTRRMSELLLQGATMTGKHCGECGDPIFRYDGQEFCPTCQREVEGSGGQQGDSAGQQSGDTEQQSDDAARQGGDAPQQGEVQQGEAQRQTRTSNSEEAGEATDDAEGTSEEIPDETADERTPPSDDEPRVEINDVRVADRHADPSNVRRPPSQQGERGDRGHGGADRSGEGGRIRRHGRGHSHANDHAHSGGHSHGRGADAPAREADDLATARAALVRKVTDLARRAEETDDAARARDLLVATREAAEALAALDRANR